MGSSHNWLDFSLSPLDMVEPSGSSQLPSQRTPQLCLLEAFTPSGWSCSEERRIRGEGSGGDVSMMGAEPRKLEDFLGGASIDRFTDHPSPVAEFQGDPKVVAVSADGLEPFPAQHHNHLGSSDQVDVVAGALPVESVNKKPIDTFGQRTSIYRGVTRHRWTGRYEAHLWDNSSRREGQTRKGRQVYLGGYDKEEKAARAYDLAALKYWGPSTTTNFPVGNYEKEIEEMNNMTRQEFVASLRRKSSGFSRGASIYRGVTRHHQHGRWQARIGRVAGNKDLYLGTFSTEEEAAEAYDIAAIKFRGPNAVTNFDMSRYDVKSIVNGNLPVGGISNKNNSKSSDSFSEKSIDGKAMDDQESQASNPLPAPIKPEHEWPVLAFRNTTHSSSAYAFLNPSAIEAHDTMDFSTSGFQQNSNGYLNNDIMLHNSSSSADSMIMADDQVAVAAARNLYYMYQQPSVGFMRASGYEGPASYNGWVAAPAAQPFQGSSPNFGVLPARVPLECNNLIYSTEDERDKWRETNHC